MNSNENFYCVISAGGKGTRLWPSSKKRMPKQFMDFFGSGRTQLQSTYDRMSNIVDKDNILVTTYAEYRDIVREQLPQLPEDNLLIEPVRRNTAPALAWACHRIMSRNAEAAVVMTPSDQVVMNEKNFEQTMRDGLQFVQQTGYFLSVGIAPTRPEPGYGYIQMGEEKAPGVYDVKSFTEKPERDFAKIFIESKEFLWNTGLFMGQAKRLLQRIEQTLPPVFARFDESHSEATIDEKNRYMTENYSLFPNLSVDQVVLEQSEQVCVMRGTFGWADLGTWHSIYEAMHKSEGDNVVVDSDVMLENCHNNVIKLQKGRVGVINGLDGFIVTESDNVLLICPKEDSSALVRKYVNEVQLRHGDEFV